MITVPFFVGRALSIPVVAAQHLQAMRGLARCGRCESGDVTPLHIATPRSCNRPMLNGIK
jgi:hypothetical protein